MADWQPMTEEQPPLPEPFDYCYEWDGPYGSRKFSVAPHNGRRPDRSVPIYKAEQLTAYAATCTAVLSARVAELERQAAQLTAERDEWAHKAQDWRHKYAELRYPGMTREVKALDAAIDAAMKETTK